MKLAQFINLLHQAYTSRNIYVHGGFGVNLSIKEQLDRHLKLNEYNRQNASAIRKAAEQHPPVYGFDCIGLIKGIIWGWCNHAAGTYGGAIYLYNDLPDCNVDGFIRTCVAYEEPIGPLYPAVGQVVWSKDRDHIAVYIGHGLVVEATRYGKSIIRIARIRGYEDEDIAWNNLIEKYPERDFCAFGLIKSPFLEYSTINEDEVVKLFTGELPKALKCYKIFDATGEVVCCAEGEIDIIVQEGMVKAPFTVVEVPVDIVPWEKSSELDG